MNRKKSRKNRLTSLSVLWQLPLACFILAGLTGFLYRVGLIGVDLFGLDLQNIRHAHSHLMFFSWAVPLPMYFIIQKVSMEIEVNEPNMLMSRMALGGLFFGLMSYPFFLLYGYRPVPVAGMDLPLSVIFSGLVMLCWYGFMAGYWKERRYVSTDMCMRFYDGALVMLFFCSLGAWGVAAVQFSGIGNPLLGKALTHFFLASFTEGWVVLVLLGLLYDRLNIDMEKLPVAPGLLVGLILFGAPLTFPYGISEGLMSQNLMMAARAGGALAAVGLGLNLYVIARNMQSKLTGYWKIILSMLVLKAFGQLLAAVLPSAFWMSDHGLRIFYLHLLLLGGFSLGLFATLHSHFKSQKGLTGMAISIILVLLSLVVLTPLWPSSWFAIWLFHSVATIAVLPALASIFFWYALNKKTGAL